MSLILDALKQAEHERGRDSAPQLFAPVIGAANSLPATAPAPRWPWAVAVTAVLAAAGALTWTYASRPPATTQAPLPALPRLPSSPPEVPALFVSPATEPGPANTPTVVPLSPAQPAAPVTAVAPAHAKPKPPLEFSPVQPPAEAQAPAVSELTTEARARLPVLNITGHTYSDNPTLRMLMIDGRMFVEGQALQPGLRLERIGPHRAMFNHQGARFSVDY